MPNSNDIAREASRWAQLTSNNGTRYSPQGDPQYDSILANAAQYGSPFVAVTAQSAVAVVTDANGYPIYVT